MDPGWWLGHPSEEYDFVNWDDYIPNKNGKIQNGNQTTNQIIFYIHVPNITPHGGYHKAAAHVYDIVDPTKTTLLWAYPGAVVPAKKNQTQHIMYSNMITIVIPICLIFLGLTTYIYIYIYMYICKYDLYVNLYANKGLLVLFIL